MSGPLRVVVVARLSDDKLRSKLAPLVAMPEVGEISLVRRTPLRMAGVTDVCPPVRLAGFTYLAEPWRLAALLRLCATRPRPSCLVSFFFVPHAVLIEIARRRFGVPTIPVAISHEDVERALTSRFWGNLLRRAHAVGVRGGRSLERLRALGLEGSRLFAPPNVFDAEGFTPAPETRKEWDVVFVGGLEPVKRLDVLLEALALARQRLGRVRALLIGDGPERARVEATRRRLGLGEAVVLAGQRPAGELVQQLRRARLLALTSRYEGLPMAVVEALACGVPVVVPDVGDVTDVAHHGENAWVVSGTGAADFAEAFEALLGEPDRLERLARGAREGRERLLTEHSLASAIAAWKPVLASLEQ